MLAVLFPGNLDSVDPTRELYQECNAAFSALGVTIALTFIDLPFAVSPVISGLIYVLLFGLQGWLGPSICSTAVWNRGGLSSTPWLSTRLPAWRSTAIPPGFSSVPTTWRFSRKTWGGSGLLSNEFRSGNPGQQFVHHGSPLLQFLTQIAGPGVMNLRRQFIPLAFEQFANQAPFRFG